MKQKTVFACQECGAQSAKWLGRCPECGAWNSMIEERPVPAAVAAGSADKRYALAVSAGPQLYADIDTVVAERLSTGIGEFDRVLGGGVVPGSLVLIGGEPGIGKSTLLLQAAAHFARAVGPVLYCSGEESEHQIKSRGERLGVERAPLYILAETCLERILEEIARLKPAFVIVDSIQTVFSLKFQSAPGSIGQVRESATQLLFAAKGQNIPTFLVGHVTKDGNLAGPKALEHIVDTVLTRGGEASRPSCRPRGEEPVRRRQRAGSLRDDRERPQASAESLAAVPRRTSRQRARIGGVVLRRRIAPAPRRGPGARQHQLYGNARRMASGLDQNRLSLLLAVLEKRAGLNLVAEDVFVNVAGGLSVDEPRRTSRSSRPSHQRAQSSDTSVDGRVRRGRPGGRNPRDEPILAPGARSCADGPHALRGGGGQCLAGRGLGCDLVGVKTASRRSIN